MVNVGVGWGGSSLAPICDMAYQDTHLGDDVELLDSFSA